jgi:RNA polymerase sigma-70 factor, ECF subfamily
VSDLDAHSFSPLNPNAMIIGQPRESDDEPLVDVDDEHLRLVLLCCHPALDQNTQVALTLRLVGGLTTTEIASAFLVPEPTLAQRIVRAKRKIREAGIPLTMPTNIEQRMDAVLGILYLVFNEGYLSRGDGDDAVRVDLSEEAIRLTRVVSSLITTAEVLGLLALQLFHQARVATRTNLNGDIVLLEDQDRTKWDLSKTAEANALLHAAMRQMRPGPYQIQAVIAGYHANARSASDTDWSAIATAYGQLGVVAPSPIVELNRVVAVAMADGPLAGLALLDQLAASDELGAYHLFHATHGELLLRAGRGFEAVAAFERAIQLTANPAEIRHLRRRLTTASLGQAELGS